MPRIYKGTTAKLALMYYPCVINPSDVSELTIAIYSEDTNEAIEYSLDDITLKDNIAFINLAKYQLDILDNGVIKYVARGVYKGNDFVQDRYSNYYIQTPKDYVIEDVAVQDIKRVDISELITNVLPDSGYSSMGEVVVDANPLINNVADNAVTLDVDKNGTYIAELADNYKGYIKEINVSVPSVNVEQLTQEEYDNITPAKDILYLISDAIPEHNLKTINGETLVGEGDIVIESGTDIPYLFIRNDGDIISGDFDAVYDAVKNNKPYLIYVYTFSNSGLYYSPAECVSLVNKNDIQCSYDLTYVALNDETRLLYRVLTISKNGAAITMDHERVIPTQFKTINGNNILGEGDITIEASVDLTGYATEQWVEEQEYAPLSDVNYLGMLVSGKQSTITDLDEIRTGAALGKTAIQEIPSEYITETELNEALANIGGGSDIPYVVIKYTNPSLNVLSGDLDAVVNAIKNNKPYLAYFYNTYSTYGQNRWLYQFTLCYADNTSFSLSYHTEISSVHKDIVINGSFDNTTQKYKLGSLAQTSHNYITSIPSEYITETELNGELEGYAKLSYVDEQLGNVNNILENIIG